MNPLNARHASPDVNYSWIKQGNQPIGRGLRDHQTNVTGSTGKSVTNGLVQSANIASYTPYIVIGILIFVWMNSN